MATEVIVYALVALCGSLFYVAWPFLQEELRDWWAALKQKRRVQ